MPRLPILLTVLIFGCAAKPEPIDFGTDHCYTCKMTLMDNHFGAEVVTNKGKIYKFDDLNCMLGFYHSQYEDVDNFEFVQVIDFSKPGTLIDARHALYLRSDNLHTPMASGVAAFENEAALKPVQKQWQGTLLSWGEIQTQFK
jgi:copper chaperone NosL